MEKYPEGLSKEEEEKSKSDEEFDAVFGDGPRKRKKEDNNQFSFQKARREIINYAIGGFEKKSVSIFRNFFGFSVKYWGYPL